MLDDVKETAAFYPQVNPETGYPDAVILDVSELNETLGGFIDGYFGQDVESVVLTDPDFVKEGTLPGEVFRPLPQQIDELTGETQLDKMTAATQIT